MIFACVTRSPELLQHLDMNIRAMSQTQPQGEAVKRQLCWLFVQPPGHHTFRSISLLRSRALSSLTEAKEICDAIAGGFELREWRYAETWASGVT